MIEGSVDLVSLQNASGWVGDRDSNQPLEVLAHLHDEVIGEAPAELYRPDLEQVGFGEGRCGFDIGFFRTIDRHDLPFVTIKVKGSNLAVPRTSRESYVDFVRSVTSQYPAAGRQRSVFGGLWTDRTDSLDVLNGRRGIGLCSPKIYAKLRTLVTDGLVELASRQGQAGEEAASSEAGWTGIGPVPAANPFVTDEFAELLRTVFDDVPVLYTTQEIRHNEDAFYQACAVEALSSPSELVLAYMASGEGARIDYVDESHELPEFGPQNLSRWTRQGAAVLPIVVAGTERAVKSVDLSAGNSVVVGPGLIHRVAVREGAVTRLVLAPKRVTPIRFLSGVLSWNDLDLGSGIRARL